MGLSRTLNKIDTILKTYLLSKKYKTNNHQATYYFRRNKRSDTLLVIFSAFHSSKFPHYNYIQTLKKVNSNQIFLLDDFGSTGLGTYYYGLNGDYFIPKLFNSLIKKILEKNKQIKKVILCGSSKGGTSALIHACLYDFKIDSIIIGGPQYRLGTYLYDHGGQDKLKEITGRSSVKQKEFLDKQMENLIAKSKYQLNVVLYYSSQEDPFHLHDCSLLVNDLKKYNHNVTEVDGHYEGHKNLANNWKVFWLKYLKENYDI